ncbi:hypothetical protein EDEG_02169 [Edhazardia aedis USNM 41457]|uniref:Uncharacterized protein n=1 Tax=Edhazardia aedis (strain USNM 41457) TaxID=1003232 RepID=J9DLM9_EDHAE|nr:hypothetical protein EDEG_02169 [Edhazardia aedis USNM 41457]|eukprot:EJW03495.1 hypothetical protein EDEG_02169 [Edhazardia aedis USNM 41457]
MSKNYLSKFGNSTDNCDILTDQKIIKNNMYVSSLSPQNNFNSTECKNNISNWHNLTELQIPVNKLINSDSYSINKVQQHPDNLEIINGNDTLPSAEKTVKLVNKTSEPTVDNNNNNEKNPNDTNKPKNTKKMDLPQNQTISANVDGSNKNGVSDIKKIEIIENTNNASSPIIAQYSLQSNKINTNEIQNSSFGMLDQQKQDDINPNTSTFNANPQITSTVLHTNSNQIAEYPNISNRAFLNQKNAVQLPLNPIDNLNTYPQALFDKNVNQHNVPITSKIFSAQNTRPVIIPQNVLYTHPAQNLYHTGISNIPLNNKQIKKSKISNEIVDDENEKNDNHHNKKKTIRKSKKEKIIEDEHESDEDTESSSSSNTKSKKKRKVNHKQKFKIKEKDKENSVTDEENHQKNESTYTEKLTKHKKRKIVYKKKPKMKYHVKKT